MESATLPRAKKPARKAAPVSTPDIKIDQPSAINLPLDKPFVHPDPKIVLPEHLGMTKEYYDELQFNEEPMTVMLMAPHDPNGPRLVDCWVNGKGIEVYIEGFGWKEFKALEVEKQYVVKRKYVGRLAQCKETSYRTSVTGNLHLNEEPVNSLIPNTHLKFPLQVIYDANPRGAEWFKKLVSGPAI